MKTTSKNLKLRIRNLVWSKNFSNLFYSSELSLRLKNILHSFPFITYSIFTPEQGSAQQGWHFQGYLEFNKTVRIEVLDKQLAFLWDETDQFFTYQDYRRGTQKDAIDYVKKINLYSDSKNTQIDHYYEFGIPKLSIYLHNIIDKKIPSSREHQEVLINRRLKENYYSKFEDIEKDFEYIFLKQRNWLKNLWNQHHPISQLNVKPARVIWLYGSSGAGKSTWTKKYLRSQNYTDFNIASISPQNMTYSDKIYFDLNYESCKVLIINEVDHFFPKHNNLISFIDRNTLLITKGSHIRNNFELIIINSLERPEKIFSFLGKNVASQILRRIYNKIFNCLVYHLFPNQDQLSQLISGKQFTSDLHFQDWYQPIIKQIPEPDYSLIAQK